MRNIDCFYFFVHLGDFFDIFNGFNKFHIMEEKCSPRYNIEFISENIYCISIVVIGFLKNELEIIVYGNMLIVLGKDTCNVKKRYYLYHGIVKRDFEYRFHLLKGMEVKGVNFSNGLLNIYIQYFSQKISFKKCCAIKIKCVSSEENV